MKILRCEQGSPEWLAARCGVASASCFADILTKARKDGDESSTRRNYRARLVVERLTGRPVSSTQSAAMAQGTEREPLARNAYMVQTGNMVEQVGFCRHDEIAAGASPDGLIGADGGLEIKCPELSAHLEYLRRADEPPAYRAQIQGCMWITGREWWDFVSFSPDFPERLQLVVRRVARDEKYIAQLDFMVRAFLAEVEAEEAEIRALPEAA